jgi:integrase
MTDSKFLSAIKVAVKHFGPRIADKITGKEIEDWLDGLKEKRGWSDANWNRWLAYLSMAFREAKRHGDVTINPARLARRKTEPEGKVRFVSEAEELKTRRAIFEARGSKKDNESCAAQLDTAIYTGMRRGEQFGLTWGQVDLKRGQIFLGDSKAEQSAYVELNSYVVHVLQKLKDRYGPSGPPSNTRVFPIDNPAKWFETALKAAGIRGVTWHTLRHTFASRLTIAGVGLKTVQELLRQRSILMAARYSHLAPDDEQEAIERLVTKEPVHGLKAPISSQDGTNQTRSAVKSTPLKAPCDASNRLSLLARIDRKALYEEVWRDPMRIVAKRYGVSDVALAKTCRKLKIPVPGRGHWAKVAAGLPVPPRPPLPPLGR